MKFIKSYTYLFALILLSYFTVKPLFIEGFFPMHDDTQVARVFEMEKALRDGMFPVRWVADLGYGYGYPIFNFYAPLAYYFGGSLALMGIDPLIAAKITIGIAMALAGIFMFLLSKEFWGNKGAFISALLYLYAPYHAVNAYVRGDVAELWAYSFVPLVFYGLWMAFKLRRALYIGVTAVGFALIVLSHNLTALMVTPFVIALAIGMILRSERKKRIKTFFYLSGSILLGLTLSAFYWIPALSEMGYTNVMSQVGGGADFRNHFVCVGQLWDSPWGYGGSIPGCVDGLSFKIGKVHGILLGAAFLLSVFFIRRQREKSLIILGSVSGFVLCAFLTLDVSRFVWEQISVMSFFQYPWRFLLLLSFFSSFVGGSVLYFNEILIRSFRFRKLISSLSFFFLSVFIIVVYVYYFAPQTVVSKYSSDYLSESVLKWHVSKISDEYMSQAFYIPTNENDIVRTKVDPASSLTRVKILENRTQKLTARIDASSNAKILVKTAYFPAWSFYIDGKKTSLKKKNNGMEIEISKGSHTLIGVFEETTIERFANAVSLLGLSCFVAAIIVRRKNVLF